MIVSVLYHCQKWSVDCAKGRNIPSAAEARDEHTNKTGATNGFIPKRNNGFAGAWFHCTESRRQAVASRRLFDLRSIIAA
jgi:hypothetical protein